MNNQVGRRIMCGPMSKQLLIAVAGYGRTGKDTFAELIKEACVEGTPIRTYKFADRVREECAGECEALGIDPWTEDPAEKELIRPFMIETGAGRREEDPRYWITALERTLAADQEPGIRIITDARYTNEVDWVLGQRGVVVLLHRRNYGPLNAEEGLHTSGLYSPACPQSYRPGFRRYWWTHELEQLSSIPASRKREQERRNLCATLPELGPYLPVPDSLKMDWEYQEYLRKRGMTVPRSMQVA